MGVTWEQVQGWHAAPLDRAFTLLLQGQDALLRKADDLSLMAAPKRWTGDAADQARAARTALTQLLEDRVAEISAARRGVFDAADAVRGVEAGVAAAREFVSANGLRLQGGTVIDDTLVGRIFPTRHDADVARADRQRVVDEAVARIDQVLRKADDVDADLARIMAAIQAGKVGEGQATSLDDAAARGDAAAPASPLDPPGGPGGPGTPATNAAWWAALSPAEQQQMINQHPDWIGNRDGVEAGARDRANRRLLPRYRTDLQHQQADLQRRLAELQLKEHRAFGPGQDRLKDQLAQVNDKLASLDTVDRILRSDPDRHLLLLDVTHERAQAAIAVGDITTAKHVAVFTPGLTSTVQGMEGNVAAMDGLRTTTERVLQSNGSSDSVATVAWLGYQAPQLTADSLLSSNSVAVAGAAQDGGRDLSHFLQGVNAARSTPADLTALGHSYGSTTLGVALRQDTGVDRAAFFGSPGLTVNGVESLKVPGGHLYAQEASGDIVGQLDRFGPSATNLHGMTDLSTGAATAPDGTPLAGIGGAHQVGPLSYDVTMDNHVHYLDQQTTSQYNLATIVAGYPDQAIGAHQVVTPTPLPTSTVHPVPTPTPTTPTPSPGPAPTPPTPTTAPSAPTSGR